MRRLLVVLAALVAVGAVVFLVTYPGGDVGPGPETGPAADRPEVPPVSEVPEAPRLEGSGVAPDEVDAPAAPLGPLPEGWFEVTALVKDGDQQLVAGARATLAIDGRVVAEARTDASGRFTLRTAVPAGGGVPEGEGVLWAGVHVVEEAAGVAWRTVPLRPDPAWPTGSWKPQRDLGVLVLAPATSLEVQVSCPEGASPPATLRVTPGQFSWAFDHLVVDTDADGHATLDGLPPGTWRILTTCAGCGRASTFVKLPRADSLPLEVHLGPARTVVVTTIDRDTNAPVSGATVEVLEELRRPDGSMRIAYRPLGDVPPTDAEGRTRIEGLAAEDVLVLRAFAKEHPLPSQRGWRKGPGTARVPAGDTEAEIPLVAARTVTWPVAAGDVPVPAEGTEIRLRPRVGSGVTVVPETGTIADGHLVVAGWPAGYAVAVAETPDGARAEIYAQPEQTEGPEITFAYTRTIEVRLRDDTGAPVSGLRVVVRNAGNHEIAPAVVSNEEGIALIEDLPGPPGRVNVVTVHLLTDAAFYGGARIGTVDLGQGDAVVEAVVGRERDVVVHVRVDGTPALPPSMRVRLGSAVPKAERDEAAFCLRLRWRPPLAETTTYVQVDAHGYISYNQRLEVTPGTEPLEIEADLRPACWIVARVTLPEDGRNHLRLQVWLAKEEVWQRARTAMVGVMMPERVDDNGELRFPPVAPGRYRIRDAYSGTSSPPIEVAPGEEPTVIELDLSGAYVVSGRVVGPESESPVRYGVHVKGLDGDTDWGYSLDGRPLGPRAHSTTTREDGTFRIRIPAGQPWTLVPSGLHLRPAAEGGTATVSGPTDDVVLRLERADLATVRFDREFVWQMNRGQPRPTRVFLYAGDPVGEPAHQCQGMMDGQTVTFSGFVPGTWTVWIDANPFAPAVLRDVVLADGDNDLGEVAATEGARLKVQVLVPEGQVPGSCSVTAVSTTQPSYTRSLHFGWSPKGFVLTGLGPGTFRVALHANMGGYLDETIEVVGDEEVELVLDLRRGK